VGAKRGRAKGNEQEAEYEEPGRKARETGLGRTGETEEAKAESGTGEATVRREREEIGKEETEAE
jgi:hypothetical protein